MKTEEAMAMLEQDNDWIAIKRLDYSLANLLQKYPDGVPDNIIASALMMTVEEVEALYQETIQELRELMGVVLD
jgi:hypothetical protein